MKDFTLAAINAAEKHNLVLDLYVKAYAKTKAGISRAVTAQLISTADQCLCFGYIDSTRVVRKVRGHPL